MFIVNAVIYTIFLNEQQQGFIFSMLLKLLSLYICTDAVKDKFMEAKMWALRIKTWMFERKTRVAVDLQTHKGNEI